MGTRTVCHMPDTPRMLTYREVAEIAGVSYETARKWAQARCFPVFDGGHRIKRVSETDLRKFLESRTSPSRDRSALTRPLDRAAS